MEESRHDLHGRADTDLLVKFLGHVAGEADAAVGGGVAGEVTLVHADAAIDAHEVKHLRALEPRAGRPGIDAVVDVLQDDVAVEVLVVAVDGGFVVDVLFHDAVAAGAGVVALGAGGDGRAAGELAAFEEIDHLLAEIDDDGGPAGHLVGMPEGAVVRAAAEEAADLPPDEARGAWNLMRDEFAAVAEGGGAGVAHGVATAQQHRKKKEAWNHARAFGGSRLDVQGTNQATTSFRHGLSGMHIAMGIAI